MANGEVNATDLTQETALTLDGSEEFVMFDSTEGKRAALSVIADYVAEHGEISGDDIPTLLAAIEAKIGTLSNLTTTDKTDVVAAINEVVSDVTDVKADIGNAYDFNEAITQGEILGASPFITSGGYGLYIDKTSGELKISANIQTAYVEIEPNETYYISCRKESVKRYALCNSVARDTPVYNICESNGDLNAIVKNTNYSYLVIQFYVMTDADTDINNYLNVLKVYSHFSAKDNRVDYISESVKQSNPTTSYMYAIDSNSMTISNYNVNDNRLIFIPLEQDTHYTITCSKTSTKRWGFVANAALNEPVTGNGEITGALNLDIWNTNNAYLALQLFVNADSDHDIDDYLDVLNIYNGLTANDAVARTSISSIQTEVDSLSNIASKVNATTETCEYSSQYIVSEKKYIDETDETIKWSASNSIVVLPLDGLKSITLTCNVSSTKKIAFADNYDTSSAVYDVEVITGTLDETFYGDHKFVVVQFFTAADVDQDIDNYLAALSINTLSAIDFVARQNQGAFYTENLYGLPILDSLSDIQIVTAAYADCAAFHNLVKTMCDNSSGYLTQHYMGQDDHNNDLYYYRTHPVSLVYGANRESTVPSWPIDGGKTVKPFRVIYTSNIHANEHNGNWVVYNLLYKILNGSGQMFKFFKNNVEIIWIPYICPTGTYENVDGQNVNRSFPNTKTGVCTSPEATLVKAVFDEFGEETDLHIDIHTFPNGTLNSENFATWIFTDSAKLGERAVRTTEDVLQEYREQYPNVTQFAKGTGSFANMLTTSSNYMQTVYGVPAGTIEGEAIVGGNPTGTDTHTSATAYLYDLITQCTIAMAR